MTLVKSFLRKGKIVKSFTRKDYAKFRKLAKSKNAPRTIGVDFYGYKDRMSPMNAVRMERHVRKMERKGAITDRFLKTTRRLKKAAKSASGARKSTITNRIHKLDNFGYRFLRR